MVKFILFWKFLVEIWNQIQFLKQRRVYLIERFPVYKLKNVKCA